MSSLFAFAWVTYSASVLNSATPLSFLIPMILLLHPAWKQILCSTSCVWDHLPNHHIRSLSIPFVFCCKLYNNQWSLWDTLFSCQCCQNSTIWTAEYRRECFIKRPDLWSSGQGLWLLTMRSRVRFPVLPWGFFLVGEDSNGDHGLGS